MGPLPPRGSIPPRRDSFHAHPAPIPPDAMPRMHMQMADPGPPQGLAPIHLPPAQGRGSAVLPGIAELTTGVSPYSTPAYSVVPTASPVHSAAGSPYLHGLHMYQPPEPHGAPKRPASPGSVQREATRRRHMEMRYEDSERRYLP
jgi:hypothetical protein